MEPLVTVSIVVCGGATHSVKAPLSSAHSNVAPNSLAVKPKFAVVLLVDDCGPKLIVVVGGTAVVNSAMAGVSSRSPLEPMARTSKVWSPSNRLLYVFGDVQAVNVPKSIRHSNVAPVEPGPVAENV